VSSGFAEQKNRNFETVPKFEREYVLLYSIMIPEERIAFEGYGSL
jgi:hypothetical protein